MESAISTPAPPERKFSFLINRDFALLWSGQSISSIGDMVFNITLLLWIATQLGAGQSWAPAAVSGIIAADLVPTFLVGPFAGVFVDRWAKRNTMLVMDALRAILILCLLPALGIVPLPGGLLGHPSVGVKLGATYAVVVLATVCSQFFGPSRTALTGDVVPPDDLTRASGMEQMTQSLAVIIGPPVAAPMLFAFGVRWALIINALSFVLSFLALVLIRAPESARSLAEGEEGNVLREFRAGLHYFAGNRTLVTLLVSLVVVMLGAGALSSLDVFFVTQNLHAQPSLYGWLEAAFGTGAILGGLGASVFAQRLGAVRIFWMSMLAAGTGMLVYSRLTSLAPALILFGVIGIPVAGVNVAIMPLLLQATPRELIGRVSSVLQPAISVASIASIGVAGLLVSTLLRGFRMRLLGTTFGPVDSVFLVAGILCMVSGVYAMRRLRGISPVKEMPAE
jgi:MFS family permease